MNDLRKQLVLELGGDPDNDYLVSDEHIISSVRRAVEAESTMGAAQDRLMEVTEERDEAQRIAHAVMDERDALAAHGGTLRVASVGGHSLPAPKPESDGAAALDIRTTESIVLYPGEERLVGTGFAYEPPPGYALFLLPRSGLGAKHGIILGNTIGLIDPDYRGELKVALWYRRSEGKPFAVARGERIAQMICVPFLGLKGIEHVKYSELSCTERGEGGFGSSGRE